VRVEAISAGSVAAERVVVCAWGQTRLSAEAVEAAAHAVGEAMLQRAELLMELDLANW